MLLADVLNNFQIKCLEIYVVDPAHFLSPPGLAWQPALRKTEVKLDLSTDINMLLMVEKGIRGRICHAIHRSAKTNDKFMKDYDKNKESSYLKNCELNNLYGWAMSQKLLLDGSKWVENSSQFNKYFIENSNEYSDEGYFAEVDVQYPEKLHDLHQELSILHERMKIEKVEKLVANLHDKKEYVMHIEK